MLVTPRQNTGAAAELNRDRTPYLVQPERLSQRRTEAIAATPDVSASANSSSTSLKGQGQSRFQLRLELQNIQTLLPKLPDLRTELQQNSPDIFCVTETNLKPTISGRLLQIPGYRLFRHDRIIGRKKSGGGVAIYINDEFNAEKITSSPKSGPSHLESIWIKASLSKRRSTLIGCFYRPPSVNAKQVHADYNELEEQLQTIIANYPSQRIIIAGDLNSDRNTNPTAHARLVELERYGLSCVVNEPTFFRGATESLLDVVLMSAAMHNSSNVPKCKVEKCDYAAHHCRVTVTTSIPRAKPVHTYKTSRNWREFDRDAFLSDVANVRWNEVVPRGDSCANQWQGFSTEMDRLLDAHAPIRRYRVRNPNPPPVSDETLELMSERRTAKTKSDWDTYRRLNPVVKRAIRRDIRNKISQTVNETSSSNLFRALKPIIAPKRGPLTSPKDITADQFNRYFVSVGPETREDVASLYQGSGRAPLSVRLPRVNAGALKLVPISLEQLRRIVFSLPNKDSSIDGEIPLKIIKLAFPIIGRTLLQIINASIVSESVPSAWKQAVVIPVHKRDDPSVPANFRPITTVPAVCKIVEKVVHTQLVDYLNDQCLLSTDQHGFVRGHSTTTALLTVTEDILRGMDESQISFLALIDLSRCFDVIDHETLITKLELLQIAPGWFRSYLKGHTQRVRVGDSLSEALPIEIGTFQGTILGSLLFNLLTNDISSYIPSTINGFRVTFVRYADDTQLLLTGPRKRIDEMRSSLEELLETLATWFMQHGMKVNAKKTELLLCGDRRQLKMISHLPEVHFMDEHLAYSNTVRNLGVTMDPELSWKHHVKQVTNRCFGLLIGLFHVRHVLPLDLLPRIIDALVMSHIRYCIQVFGSACHTVITEIQRIINFSARILSGRRKYDHISDVLQQLNWLNAPQLVAYFDLTLMHRILLTNRPLSLRCLFSYNHETVARSTRQSSHLSLFRPGTNHGKRCFAYRAATLYNSVAMREGLNDLTEKNFKHRVRTLVQRL